tara:strand:+ start:1957 stop:2382 length:426 start_codon:yes stop_codon:yes gene_type:complete
MAALDLNTVREKIEEKLIDEFSNVPPLEIVFGNQPFQPVAGTGFIQCLIEFTTNGYLTLGGITNSFNSQEGVITINIFTKIGVGMGNNFTVAKRIRDLYNRVRINDIFFEPSTGPTLIETAAPEGYVQSVMSIPFTTIETL